jgi:hypothetical protein
MKEFGVVDSWTKQFTIDLSREISRVLGLRKVHDWGLSSYEPESQQVTNLGICGRSYYFHVDHYMENLVLLNKPNDVVSRRVVSTKRKYR